MGFKNASHRFQQAALAGLAAASAAASPFAAAEAPPADPPGAIAETGSGWAPSLSPSAGLGVPITGIDLGFRVGVKATLLDLSDQTPGLSLVVPLTFTFEKQITGGELAAGFEYGRALGSSLAWYADLTLGYRHDHQVIPVRFLGYQELAGNFFVARLSAGLSYRIARSIRAFVEPINFGFYRGSGTALDWAPQLGVEVRL